MTRPWWIVPVAVAISIIATLPIVGVYAAPNAQTAAMPYVISASDGSAFLAAAPVNASTWRFVFFGSGVATAAVTVTAKTRADCACVRLHHNFPALLYAEATPLGVMNGLLGLDATLNATGFVGRVKAAVAVPGGDNAAYIVSHFVLNAPMTKSDAHQARLVAGAVEAMLFAQHWSIIYFWSSPAVRASESETAFSARLARLFAARAGLAQVTPAGPPGQPHSIQGVTYDDMPITVSFEQSAKVHGRLSNRGVTRACAVRVTWDTGAWRYASLPCAPAVFTAWFPQR